MRTTELTRIVATLRKQGIDASVVMSDSLPDIWTELGWLCMPRGLAWCSRHGLQSAECESELEALQQVTLWKLESASKNEARKNHLRLVR